MKTGGLAVSRGFWPLTLILLGGMGALQVSSVFSESQTMDESNQLVTGYAYLKTGHYTLGLEHPPLVKILLAIPLWSLNPRLPANYPATPKDGGMTSAGLDFLYRNNVPADRLLLRSRAAAVAISLLLGFAIAFWTRRWFGPVAALLALSLYVFDPNFLAHGRYIKNDVALALVYFSASAAWGSYLVSRTRRDLAMAGLLLGIALVTKFSAVLLFPVFLLLLLIRRWQVGGRDCALPALVRSMAAATAIAVVVILLAYRFDAATLSESELYGKALRIPALARVLGPPGPLGAGIRWLAETVPIPAVSFLRGLVAIGHKDSAGQDMAYLLGRQSRSGWWYYSFVVLLVKTPLAMLGAFGLAVALALRRAHWNGWRSPRDIQFRWFVVAIPPLLYFAASLATDLNAGVRHLLPVFPFAFVFVAAVLLGGRHGRAAPWIAWAAVALLLVESTAIYPHYLAFFNAAVGGPAAGPNYLLDSNIDWGQDARHLKSYLEARGVTDACVDYFGLADLDYYGIGRRALPPLREPADLGSLDCLVAISVSRLFLPGSGYDALRALGPQARIGYSIYVYDLRKHRRSAR